MKNIYWLLLISITFFSCNKAEMHNFKFHSLENSLEVKNINEFPVLYKAKILKNKISIESTKSGFLAEYKFKVTELGIFISQDNQDELIYPFKKNKIVKRNDKLQSLFLETCELISIKEYIINHRSYRLYYFIEENGDMAIDSYYLENEGFICFYRHYDGNFLYSDSKKALDVSKLFLNDSVFFNKIVLEVNKQEAMNEFLKNDK